MSAFIPPSDDTPHSDRLVSAETRITDPSLPSTGASLPTHAKSLITSYVGSIDPSDHPDSLRHVWTLTLDPKLRRDLQGDSNTQKEQDGCYAHWTDVNNSLLSDDPTYTHDALLSFLVTSIQGSGGSPANTEEDAVARAETPESFTKKIWKRCKEVDTWVIGFDNEGRVVTKLPHAMLPVVGDRLLQDEQDVIDPIVNGMDTRNFLYGAVVRTNSEGLNSGLAEETLLARMSEDRHR